MTDIAIEYSSIASGRVGKWRASARRRILHIHRPLQQPTYLYFLGAANPHDHPRMPPPTDIDLRSPPTLDATATQQWWRQLRSAEDAPWLHREVASRMMERLELLKLGSGHKLLWEPTLAGTDAFVRFRQRFGTDQMRSVETGSVIARVEILSAAVTGGPPQVGGMKPMGGHPLLNTTKTSPLGRIWAALRPGPRSALRGGVLSIEEAIRRADAALVCSNLLLHAHPVPARLIADWHAALSVGGCTMFTALGVDTGKEIAQLHAELGLGPSGAQLTDMHDWGDMLVSQGFTDPVMDMEHLKLTYSDVDALLADWRSFGRNGHVNRFAGLRGRKWLAHYKAALSAALRQPDGRLKVTVEVIYGHAFKPEPRVFMSSESAISMREMRQMLSKRRSR